MFHVDDTFGTLYFGLALSYMHFIVMGVKNSIHFTGSSYIEFGHRGHFMHGKFQPRLKFCSSKAGLLFFFSRF